MQANGPNQYDEDLFTKEVWSSKVSLYTQFIGCQPSKDSQKKTLSGSYLVSSETKRDSYEKRSSENVNFVSKSKPEDPSRLDENINRNSQEDKFLLISSFSNFLKADNPEELRDQIAKRKASNRRLTKQQHNLIQQKLTFQQIQRMSREELVAEIYRCEERLKKLEENDLAQQIKSIRIVPHKLKTEIKIRKMQKAT